MRLIRKIRSKKDSKVLAMIEKANLFKRYVYNFTKYQAFRSR